MSILLMGILGFIILLYWFRYVLVGQMGTGMGLGQTGGWGTGQSGMGIGQAGMGVSQIGMGAGQTGIGVGQTGMGVSQTGMGTGSNTSAFGSKFNTSPMFASKIVQVHCNNVIPTITAGGAQFGSRPVMGTSMIGSTATTR